jgi:hypothetical protein
MPPAYKKIQPGNYRFNWLVFREDNAFLRIYCARSHIILLKFYGFRHDSQGQTLSGLGCSRTDTFRIDGECSGTDTFMDAQGQTLSGCYSGTDTFRMLMLRDRHFQDVMVSGTIHRGCSRTDTFRIDGIGCSGTDTFRMLLGWD